jgi:hypothetical protein
MLKLTLTPASLCTAKYQRRRRQMVPMRRFLRLGADTGTVCDRPMPAVFPRSQQSKKSALDMYKDKGSRRELRDPLFDLPTSPIGAGFP